MAVNSMLINYGTYFANLFNLGWNINYFYRKWSESSQLFLVLLQQEWMAKWLIVLTYKLVRYNIGNASIGCQFFVCLHLFFIYLSFCFVIFDKYEKRKFTSIVCKNHLTSGVYIWYRIILNDAVRFKVIMNFLAINLYLFLSISDRFMNLNCDSKQFHPISAIQFFANILICVIRRPLMAMTITEWNIDTKRFLLLSFRLGSTL